MANPGAASTVTTTYQNVANNQALVLIGAIQGMSLNAAGDIAMATIGPVGKFVPTSVLTCNATGDVHLATVGIYTQTGQGGTAVLTTAALTSQTTAAYAKVQAATAAAAVVTPNGEYLYVNIGTTAAGLATDVYLYGYVVG